MKYPAVPNTMDKNLGGGRLCSKAFDQASGYCSSVSPCIFFNYVMMDVVQSVVSWLDLQPPSCMYHTRGAEGGEAGVE